MDQSTPLAQPRAPHRLSNSLLCGSAPSRAISWKWLLQKLVGHLRSQSGNQDHWLTVTLRRWPLITCCVLVGLAGGCAPDDLETTYGRLRGVEGGVSVNGTAVFAKMFDQAGFSVRTWRRLSPRLERADVVVWIPDDFQPPTLEQRGYLEEWLANGNGRTLIYVGRDFDAGIHYWEAVRQDAPADQAIEIARRLAMTRSQFSSARAAMPETENCGWFTLRRKNGRRVVSDLDGPWSAGIDVTETQLEIASELEPPMSQEVEQLLSFGRTPLAFQRHSPEWKNGKIVVVANGSFLLNLPLVQHEHRKLAGKLVSLCSGKRAVFLESEAGGPDILLHDPNETPSGLEMFTVAPLGTIVLHLAVLGITLCIVRFPIFGRPREVEIASTSDFGQHVTALGELLALTKDRQYALDRLTYYKEHVRGDGTGS